MNSVTRPVWSVVVVVVVAVACFLHAAAALAALGEDVVGKVASVRVADEDTVVELARRHDLGFVELMVANPGVDVWLPRPGLDLVLPRAHMLPEAPHQGIVINLGELRLYLFSEDGQLVLTAPVGVGREAWETPTGTTVVVAKRLRPTWFPPPSVRDAHPELPAMVPPGPDNPLGDHALYLGWPRYLVHGTNKPYGVGRRVSRGCIRLYPEDMERLFAAVPVGTPVTVVDQPVKVGWSGGRLHVEVHPTQSQVDEIEQTGRFTPAPILGLEERVAAVAAAAAVAVDWTAVRRAAEERSGIPVAVSR
ncbi:MAG: L,D-transpeptidase family protein [Alphaproteobacteria bacterium]